MKLAVLTPSARDPKWKFLQSIDQMRIYIQTHGINGVKLERLEFMTAPQCSLLSHGRQTILDDALAGPSTHAVFVDDDMRFAPNILDPMGKSMAEINAKAAKVTEVCAVIGANALRKGLPPRDMKGTADGMMFTAATMDGFIMSSHKKIGYEEARDTGMGFVLIDLNAIRSVPKPHFEVMWDESEQDYVGEDRYFMRKLRAGGLRIFIDHDASALIGHIGDFDYSMDTMRLS